MDLHMSDTKRALEDDGDKAETNNMNDDPFLSLIRSEQSSAPVNVISYPSLRLSTHSTVLATSEISV